MDLKILKIAANTKNNRLLKNYDYKTKQKNSICGDEIEVSIKLNRNKIENFGFHCKSCIYSQASAAMLSNFSVNKKIIEILELRKFLINYVKNKENKYPKKWLIFQKLLNKKNLARKECLMLPFNAIDKINKIMK